MDTWVASINSLGLPMGSDSHQVLMTTQFKSAEQDKFPLQGKTQFYCRCERRSCTYPSILLLLLIVTIKHLGFTPASTPLPPTGHLTSFFPTIRSPVQ